MKNKGRKASPPVISLITLGCSKNFVDSERVLGGLAESGFLIAQDPAHSEICLVNTCGFIDEARQETAGVLKELNDLKGKGSLKTVIALGCLVERAADASELGKFLNHADARLGFKDYPNIANICKELIERHHKPDADAPTEQAPNETVRSYTNASPLPFSTDANGKTDETPDRLPAEAKRDYTQGPTESAAKKPVPKSYNDFLVTPRLRIGSPHHAFLKISEGCSNPCRFCAIPRMRGLHTSRSIEDIVTEARELAEGGTQEISLIAQDTSSYGRDRYKEYKLPALLRELLTVEGPAWFRLMYAYPRHLNDEMLDTLTSDPRFCPYIDMPLQHISDSMLSLMARGVTKQQSMDLLDRIAKKLPNGALRTTFIVGYPGETEQDFEEVVTLVKEGRFAHAGVFLYSPEPLTPAYKTPDTLPLSEKKRRQEAIMLAQQDVSRKRLAARVGQTIDVLVDAHIDEKSKDTPKGAKAIGRSQLEAPEVDGIIYIKGSGAKELTPGTLVKARIVGSSEYDLVAQLV